MVQHYREDAQQLGPPSQRFSADDTQIDEQQAQHRADPPADFDRVYRGFKGGAAFYGWLIAVGLTVLLTGIVGAVAAAVDYAITIDWNQAEAEANTVGIVSGAVLVLILAIAYYKGGYVAGRLARFDGGRQGFGVWMIGVVVTAIVALIAALAGSQYDILDRVDIPSVPIADETLTAGGLILAGAVLLATLIASVLGGKAGARYHRHIDEIRG
jgi:heme/copper-type cytochrome/quinol oxidase subunit 1